MQDVVRPVVTGALRDLERACEAIDVLRLSSTKAASAAGFELGEASHAAHRALLALRDWDWAPGSGPSTPPVAVDRN